MEKKTQQFKAEIAEMLDLVVNSLYSKKEIFLRELISNASDAIDRAKFLSLTDKALVQDNPEWKIQIAADKGAKTLMISDNGIGMDAAELEQNLGTIASSGTKKFREMLKEKGGESLPELIGQFGVGFYAAFMVADKVTVETMKRGTEVSCKWESDMSGGYTISDGERDFPGTSITLHLRDDQLEYLDWWRVSDLVKKYSDFIAYPITFRQLDVPKDEKEEDRKSREEREAKPLNTMVALWKRAKKDVKDEEYAEFYKHLTHDWDGPFETIPFGAEGQVEFKALLFFPKKPTMELFMPNQKRGLSLYVRNVFIGDDIEMLLPSWLRFVKGVVDSSDLPLNVSREMLQDDAVVQKIKSAVTAKVLSTLEDMKKKDAKKYDEFFAAFGAVLKEGIHTDWEHADRIKKLVKYPTARTEAGKRIFLEDYVKDMASGPRAAARVREKARMRRASVLRSRRRIPFGVPQGVRRKEVRRCREGRRGVRHGGRAEGREGREREGREGLKAVSRVRLDAPRRFAVLPRPAGARAPAVDGAHDARDEAGRPGGEAHPRGQSLASAYREGEGARGRRALGRDDAPLRHRACRGGLARPGRREVREAPRRTHDEVMPLSSPGISGDRPRDSLVRFLLRGLWYNIQT